jgi:lysophospholipase L1-like esterase
MSPVRSLFALFLLIAVTTAVRAASLKTAALLGDGKEPVRVVCIGDSITGVYYHTGSLRAYPEMLEIALRKLYPRADVTVRNAGISGDTTKGGLARLDRDVLKHQPHLVTVMFGMNDMVRTPIDEFRNNLVAMIERCRKSGAEVVLCTQNSVVETPQRPTAKLAEFTKAIHEIARATDTNVADCHAAFSAVSERSKAEWQLLLSDAIHPNMDGHKLFAETIARTISGRSVSLADVGAPEPALRHTFAKLHGGGSLKVLAMPPYDDLVKGALERLFPGAKVAASSWAIEGQTLAQLDQSADKVRKMGMDLVVIAIPPGAGTDVSPAPQRHYSWIMNRSLSFGPQEWDVVVVLPSVTDAHLGEDGMRLEERARRSVAAQDLHAIPRQKGDASSAASLLDRWIEAQHVKWKATIKP